MIPTIISTLLIGGSAYLLYRTRAQNRTSESALGIKRANADRLQDQIDALEEESRAQHEKIDIEKELIEKESANITTSIHYAEGIQRSLIPTPKKIQQAFPESFVYFEPKDIVSGDYYDMYELQNFTVMVVADCTGHGVPGGFLSMLGMAGLRKLLPHYQNSTEIHTGEILCKMREFIISSLAEAIESEDDSMGVNDGMDMTMAAFSKDRRKLTFSLADHNIYLVRDGEVEKLKGDRMPIGRHPNQDKPFEEKSLILKPNDMIYLCSDGVQDQIGGPDDCKFLTKRLAQMVREHAHKDIRTQHSEMQKIINDWKRGYEQVDDQTLIGIRIQ